MLNRTRRLSILSLLVFVGIGLAKANTITDPTVGSSYTLTYTSLGNNQYDIFLNVVTSTTPLGSTDTLHDVALKLVNSASEIATADLVTPPTPGGFTTTVMTGLNANGCAGGGDGFFCSAYAGSGNGLTLGGTYDFEWILTLTPGSNLFLGTNEASVKAGYDKPNGNNAGITSQDITLDTTPSPIPEPSSLLMLGSGLVALAGFIRRKISV